MRLYGKVMKDRFKNIRLVVSDIDGTLLTADNALHEGSAAAIQAVRQKPRCDFTLSTGRSFRLSNPLMGLLEIQLPFIFSGGAIYDPSMDAVLTDHFIGTETVDAIRHFARERQLGLMAHTSNCILCMLNDSDWRRIADIEWIKGKRTDHAKRVDSILADKEPPIIRLDIFSEDQPLAAAYLQICHKFPQLHAVEMTRSIELTPVGVNKGSALKQLAQILHVELESVMAIGDSLNDLALLEQAGIGIAMATAPDALKTVADIVVPPSDQGGFADALNLISYFSNN